MPTSYRTTYVVNPGKKPAVGMLDSVEYTVPAKNFIAAVSFVASKIMSDCPGLEEYSDIKDVVKRIKELGTYEAVFEGESKIEPQEESETEPEVPQE